MRRRETRQTANQALQLVERSARTSEARVRGTAQPEADIYAAFERIDGRHPWQAAVPEGFVLYPVRRLERGRVTYFNFALAREMGLIDATHDDVLTLALTEKILSTFCLQIVNEYDQQHNPSVLSIHKKQIKPYPYMATRYLQLQHANKQGATSGDGRSIWNGILKHGGTTWDISSRGTGVTKLAPGAVEANRPIKTGDNEHGYGCGLADVTELLGSAVMSEIFHLNGVGTERVLTVIDVGRGCGIGVRVAPNLLRPAHLFLFLKQGKLDPLRRATDYLIERETANGNWKFNPFGTNRYRSMLKEVSQVFARFAATLERNYIFAWLDWDGDNVLANGGIIDYGSIRQFGLCHDQYRYDDVQRFSTNLNEQRGKARATLQVFAQLVDYLETGERKPVEDFDTHVCLKDFDRNFDLTLQSVALKQVGFDEQQSMRLIKSRRRLVREFNAALEQVERIKTKDGLVKLPDGVNRPPTFNVRKLLRELPTFLVSNAAVRNRAGKGNEGKNELRLSLSVDDMIRLMAAKTAKRSDLKLRGARRVKVERLHALYVRLVNAAQSEESESGFFDYLVSRAYLANRPGRITGNGSEFVVEAVLKAQRKGVSVNDIQTALDLFIASQAANETALKKLSPTSPASRRSPKPISIASRSGRLFQELVKIAHEFEEDI